MNDPYLVLGVTKKASLEEIKAAYKKLARKHHPDLNPGKKASEEKFKEVAHAYEQIGTADARAKFEAGETPEQRQQEYDESVKRNSRGPTYQETQQKGGRYSYDSAAGMDDDIFAAFFGKNKAQQAGHRSNDPGGDELYQLEIDFHESAVGGQRVVTLPNGKKLQVQIPGGITSGQKLKFKGQGKADPGAGTPGDLYIQVTVKPSEHFKREGKDIISEVAVSFLRR
jgi:DnaJ-class molecular chaperone